MIDLFAYFRRRRPIDNLPALATFIDENAAFLVQKGIYEYSRARAGHYSKVLFQEAGFMHAVEVSRWRAYPYGLAMVTELVEGVLHRDGDDDRRARVDALGEVALSVFDRYPTPAAIGAHGWRDARAELARRLAVIGLHPPKRAGDVPEPLLETYFNLMPIHEKLRAAEFRTISNYLRVTAINIHDEFTKRVNVPSLIGLLRMPLLDRPPDEPREKMPNSGA